MPLKIILLTDNHVGTAMKDNKQYFLKGFYDELDKGICEQIKKLFDCGFDYILTTNYSYELEYTVYGDKFTENRLKNIQKYVDVDKADPKYQLHTFNQVNHEGTLFIQLAFNADDINNEQLSIMEKINELYPSYSKKGTWHWRLPLKTQTIVMKDKSQEGINSVLDKCYEEVIKFERSLEEKGIM